MEEISQGDKVAVSQNVINENCVSQEEEQIQVAVSQNGTNENCVSQEEEQGISLGRTGNIQSDEIFFICVNDSFNEYIFNV